jgi:hypothetical protein
VARDRVRDEAERLVAAAIAAVSLAARGMGAAGRSGSGFSTGSAECCVCPVCRLIASMRDPNADLAERLAAGAGDLATGVASMLRVLGRSGHGDHDHRGLADGRSRADDRSREGDEFWESLRQRATEQARAWSGSSGFGRARPTDVDDGESDVERDPWRTATAAAPTEGPKPMAKKAVAKKTVAKKTVAKKTVAKKTVAKKTVAPKLPAAAEPATPPPRPVPPATSTAAAKKAPKKAVPTKAASKKAAPKRAIPRPEEIE